jgi:hypothetical protein
MMNVEKTEGINGKGKVRAKRTLFSTVSTLSKRELIRNLKNESIMPWMQEQYKSIVGYDE